jgi:hypothetical protein
MEDRDSLRPRALPLLPLALKAAAVAMAFASLSEYSLTTYALINKASLESSRTQTDSFIFQGILKAYINVYMQGSYQLQLLNITKIMY